MAGIRYLDFDLQIQRVESHYRVEVDSPAGQASATFRLPFSDLELENFLLRVGRTRRATRRIDSPEVKAAKDFGQSLFDAVFTGELRGVLRSSIEESRRQGGGLRIRLRLTDVPELADLPWEYLYNPALNRFLGLSVSTPLVRYLDLPERIDPLLVSPPLKILVMISSPHDYPQLDVEREWTKLREALG
ncbi:MAG: CHAT domain-containing protein, partial [Armatimonadota bacterium]